MADQGNEIDEAVLAAVARHALHDEELIAAFATGDVEDGADASRAQALIDRCAVCRDLHHDLVDIGTALRAAAASPAQAPRDFRLSVDDARRLGGQPRARGFLAGLRESIATFGRPVGATLATFGLVGLLVGSATLGGFASSSSTAIDRGGTPVPAAAGASPPAGEFGAGSELTGPAQSTDVTGAFRPLASPKDDVAIPVTPGNRDAALIGPSAAAWLLIGSIGMLVAGIVLVVLAERRRPGVRARTQDR